MSSIDPALARRVEQAQLHSWPAPHTEHLDGWVLRSAAGYTRRANAATPLDPCRAPLARQLDRIAAAYAALGKPAIIRTRSFDDPALPRTLRAHGWVPEGASTVLAATLRADAPSDPAVEIVEGAPSPDWHRDHTRLSAADPAKRDPILAMLTIPCAFAGLRAEPGSSFVACAFAAIHDRIACLHLVVTDPAHRRRGLSRRVVATLLAWAGRHGAGMASLQVDSGNASALALYAGLGFRTPLFTYLYWREPERT